MWSTLCRWFARCCAHYSSAGCSPRTPPPRMPATRLSSPQPTVERSFSSLTPALIVVRLAFSFASFHPVVLIDVADVEPASSAHRIGRLPVSGTVQDVIVGTTVERVGGSFPQNSSRPLPPRIVSAPAPPIALSCPAPPRTRSRPFPPYSPASGPSPP